MVWEDLINYRRIKAEVIGIIEQIKELESVMYDPSHPKWDTQPRSTVSHDLSDVMIRYLDLQKTYQEKLNHYLEISQEIDKAMEKLTLQEKQVLRARYIFGLSVSRTARQENYSERQVIRIVKRAKKKL